MEITWEGKKRKIGNSYYVLMPKKKADVITEEVHTFKVEQKEVNQDVRTEPEANRGDYKADINSADQIVPR